MNRSTHEPPPSHGFYKFTVGITTVETMMQIIACATILFRFGSGKATGLWALVPIAICPDRPQQDASRISKPPFPLPPKDGEEMGSRMNLVLWS
jgi:hypothetical protein